MENAKNPICCLYSTKGSFSVEVLETFWAWFKKGKIRCRDLVKVDMLELKELDEFEMEMEMEMDSLKCRNFDSNGLSTAPESGFVKEEKESDFDSNEFNVILRHVGQILDADGKKDTKADPLRVEADPLRVKADICLDIGGGKHQVGVGLHHDIEVDQTLKEAGHHFIVKELREGEQMLKPHFHQFPLTVRETDVLPTQLVIPQTSLAPILVNTFQPPPARCMPPNQPSTFITSQQHQMSHCLQGQSRSYQNYYQSEKDAYFDEKHCIISTIKSPPLPSCPPPPLPPPPPQPSPPPLQLGHTAKNADTSNIKLGSIPYIKLKVIKNIHDEKREIERILSIRKSKDPPHTVQDSLLDRLLRVEQGTLLYTDVTDGLATG
uniref:Uncharacterized protein n=1 Tax=Timema genevievae TaxID=629358 RepID=A0A7R9PNK5_TIMGE|nr:unnamed protein product [Timema genevievae]